MTVKPTTAKFDQLGQRFDQLPPRAARQVLETDKNRDAPPLERRVRDAIAAVDGAPAAGAVGGWSREGILEALLAEPTDTWRTIPGRVTFPWRQGNVTRPGMVRQVSVGSANRASRIPSRDQPPTAPAAGAPSTAAIASRTRRSSGGASRFLSVSRTCRAARGGSWSNL